MTTVLLSIDYLLIVLLTLITRYFDRREAAPAPAPAPAPAATASPTSDRRLRVANFVYNTCQMYVIIIIIVVTSIMIIV